MSLIQVFCKSTLVYDFQLFSLFLKPAYKIESTSHGNVIFIRDHLGFFFTQLLFMRIPRE